MTSSNLIDFGLSEEEYRRRKNKRAELKKALRGCTSGDLRGKAYVKQVIADLLEQRYTLDDQHLNLLLPFDDPQALTAQDQFDILLYLYKKTASFKRAGRAYPHIRAGSTPSGAWTTRRANRTAYSRGHPRYVSSRSTQLSTEDKTQVVVQRILPAIQRV